MTPFLICFIQKDLVPITTKVVSSNPVHGEAYPIQHYVIKFVSDLRWFSTGTPVFSTNKTDCHDITQILLKVALNTINPLPKHKYAIYFFITIFYQQYKISYLSLGKILDNFHNKSRYCKFFLKRRFIVMELTCIIL